MHITCLIVGVFLLRSLAVLYDGAGMLFITSRMVLSMRFPEDGSCVNRNMLECLLRL